MCISGRTYPETVFAFSRGSDKGIVITETVNNHEVKLLKLSVSVLINSNLLESRKHEPSDN